MLRLYRWNLHAAGNHHGIGELFVDWLKVVEPIAVVEDSYYSRMGAANNFDDPSLSSTISAPRT